MLTTDRTIAAIAAELPAAIPVFEQLGIDYCCGGRRSLADACGAAGVPVERVLQLLTHTPPDQENDWRNASSPELIRHIVGRHHAYARQASLRIDALLSKVVTRHAAAHPELQEIAAAFHALSQELAAHLLREENVLFPLLESLGAPPATGLESSLAAPIRRMTEDHDDAGAMLARLRELTDGYRPPSDACPPFTALYRNLEEFEHDLHLHVHLENNILFPRFAPAEPENPGRNSQ